MLQLLGFIIDCPDPMKLATFYSQVTGRAIREGSSRTSPASRSARSIWPSSGWRTTALRAGLTASTPSSTTSTSRWSEIEPEQRRVVKLGATLQKDFIGPEGYGWQVYTDPVGHPFCLCRHEGVTWTDKGLRCPNPGPPGGSRRKARFYT